MRRTSSISRRYQWNAGMSFVLMACACQHRRMPFAPQVPVPESTLVIRVATRADDADLRRLAALDSARPLAGRIIVAQSDGRIDAALSLEDGRTIADPFRPTAGLVDVLRARAARLRGDQAAPARLRRLRLLAARPSVPVRRPAPPRPLLYRGGGARPTVRCITRLTALLSVSSRNKGAPMTPADVPAAITA